MLTHVTSNVTRMRLPSEYYSSRAFSQASVPAQQQSCTFGTRKEKSLF